jgi:TorA maturation chaperone TorD
MNLANDQIRVYQGTQRTARDLDDLLDAMEGDSLGAGQIKGVEWMSLASSRAQVYEFHAAIYIRAVDNALLANLRASGLQITGALEQGEDLTGDLQEGATALQRFQRAMGRCAPEIIQAELEQEYNRLLEYGAPGNLQACESFYTTKTDQAYGLVRAEVMRAYTEAGVALCIEMMRQPDFIGCELNFMGQLCAQEYGAWRAGDRRGALHVQMLESAFLKDHLVRWAPRYCDFLIGQTEKDFYRGMACLTKGFVLNEAYRVAELMEWNCLSRD